MLDTISVFPDTNIFLHYPPVNQFDWLKICQAKQVQLVVCMTVIHELDDKKSDSRLAERAEKAIRLIRNSTKNSGDLRDGVTIETYNKEVKAADFPDTLSPESADDRIVHLVKMFKEEHSVDEVAILTSDLGMELRAGVGGIRTFTPDSSDRLANPQDEQTKKFRQAVVELNELKNRQPKLSLGLSLPEESIKVPHEVVFCVGNPWQMLDIEAEMRKVKEEYPKQARFQPPSNNLDGSSNLMAAFGQPERWENYDKKLDKFYDKCRTYFENKNIVGEAKSRAFKFDLWLTNEGTSLASDIDITLQFQANICFVAKMGSEDAEPLEKEIEPPNPPVKPSLGISGLLRRNYSPPTVDFSNLVTSQNFRTDDWTPYSDVSSTSSDTFEIHTRLGKIKHGHPTSLGQFIGIFGAEADIQPFKVEFSITSSDLVEKSEGSFPFRVER